MNFVAKIKILMHFIAKMKCDRLILSVLSWRQLMRRQGRKRLFFRPPSHETSDIIYRKYHLLQNLRKKIGGFSEEQTSGYIKYLHSLWVFVTKRSYP
jgi:hypothetical protein